jgi:hypothetical protein
MPARKRKVEVDKEVEKILDVRTAKRKREFLVKYKDQDEQTWVPENQIDTDLIQEFDDDRAAEKKKNKVKLEKGIEEILARAEEELHNNHGKYVTREPFYESNNCCMRCLEVRLC